MKLFYLQDSISFLQKQSLRADIQGYLKVESIEVKLTRCDNKTKLVLSTFE
jgi:hypothetical protein